MIIGINALYIKWSVNAGTETYFTNIVKPWYDDNFSNAKFLLLCNQPPHWWRGSKDHFKIKLFPKSRNLLYRLFIEQLFLPIFLIKKVDMLFNPGYVGCSLLTLPQVTTIHDGFAWLYPKEIGILRTFYWKLFIPYTARLSTYIIADSKNTAFDIRRFCHINSNKIKVIYLGGSHLNKTSTNSYFLNNFNLESKSYFHCIGFFKDIKNPYRILEAFQNYKNNNPDSNSKLVLAGHVGCDKGQKILDYAKSLSDVVYVGRINDHELIQLYINSLGLIFTSLYEGFGIPILEAQELCCPVVTSKLSSMKEIAGDSAILVNPLNIDEIEKAFKILDYNDLSSLISRGLVNAKRFSWHNTSRETLALLCESATNNKT